MLTGYSLTVKIKKVEQKAMNVTNVVFAVHIRKLSHR